MPNRTLNRDGMRTLVVPELFVDISGVMDTKLQMLGCHESQRQWLDETQGLDDYLETMRQASAEVARMRPDCRLAVCRGVSSTQPRGVFGAGRQSAGRCARRQRAVPLDAVARLASGET